jgi:MSHA biogenesis protein MshI
MQRPGRNGSGKTKVRSLLNRRKAKSGTTVGVAYGTDGVALAAVRGGGRDAPPRLTHAAHIPLTSQASAAERIGAWIADSGLEKCRGVGVIADGEYQVVQVEAPAVPATEMRQAAAWRVRDLLDFPIDQAVIDTFPPPDSAQRGQHNINVVVARRALITERIEQLTEAGLALEAIDIPELVQRNISARLPETRGGHALLALGAEDGLITVFREGEQFLARGLDAGLNGLAQDSEDTGETLLLEVQRSFDYFESALSQPPLGALYLYPAGPAIDVLSERFTDNLGNVAVRAFALGDLVQLDTEPPEAGAQLLHAVGAALREGQKSR